MARIAHLSDPLFGEADSPLVRSLAADIRKQAPAAVLASGDLTRRATASEFAAAPGLRDSLGAPLLTAPGNHGIRHLDLVARYLDPCGRWLGAWPGGFADALELQGRRLIEIDRVSRAQWDLDWTAGAISARRREGVAAALAEPFAGATMLVCHHSPKHSEWASARRPRRSNSCGRVISALCSAVICIARRSSDPSVQGHGRRSVSMASSVQTDSIGRIKMP